MCLIYNYVKFCSPFYLIFIDDRRSQTYSTEDLVNILTARIDRGETLPTDATETEGIFITNL